jgi:hypothetical protein
LVIREWLVEGSRKTPFVFSASWLPGFPAFILYPFTFVLYPLSFNLYPFQLNKRNELNQLTGL